MPLWCSSNLFLLTGYRPIFESIEQCVESLDYVHNETVNIYSHLMPAVIIFIRAIFIHFYFRGHYPNALWIDYSVFYPHLSVSILCFSVSTLYHIFLSHSKFYTRYWSRLDYVGILVNLVGSGISGTHFGFYCKSNLPLLYLPLIGLTSIIN